MNKGSERLEPIIDEAVETLRKIFQADEPDTGELVVARLATSALATWAKLKQSEGAQEAVYFSIARELAQDKEQLAHYIEITLPHLPLAAQGVSKKLPAPKGK